MRFRDPKRLRIISGATLLLVLTSVPVLLGLTRPAPGHEASAPGIVKVYTSGLTAMGWGGWIALGFAVLFGLWLIAGERQQVARKFLAPSSRRKRNLVEIPRALAIIFGAAGIIVGTLSGLYTAMIGARPDLLAYLPPPPLSISMAVTSLVVGAAVYTMGRIGRYGL